MSSSTSRAPPRHHHPSVWLGLPGDVIYDEPTETDAYSTRVGGTPCLFADPSLASSSSSAAATAQHLSCGACSEPLPLVAQAYAPTERHPHRSLLVFGCARPGCGRKAECWRAVRCLAVGVEAEGAARPAPEEPATAAPAATAEKVDPWAAALEGGGDGFGGSAEDTGFGGGDEWGAAAASGGGLNSGFAALTAELDTIAAEAEAKKKEKGTSNAKQQPAAAAAETAPPPQQTGWRGWPGANDAKTITPLPPFHLYAEEEPKPGKRRAVYRRPGGGGEQQEGQEDANANNADDADTTTTTEDGDGPLAAEAYERDAPPAGVAASYVRFGQRLARKPDQCARYVAPSSAAASSSSSSSSSGLLWPLARNPRPSPCPRCGAPRRFELQLMPALIAVALEAGQELGMEVVVGGGGVEAGEDGDGKAGPSSQPASSSQPQSSNVLAGVSDWEWCTVAVFTCSADCDGVGSKSSNKTNNGASSAPAAATPAAPLVLLTEEAVALANEADVHTKHAEGDGGGAGGRAGRSQEATSDVPTTGGGEDDEDDDDEDDDGW